MACTYFKICPRYDAAIACPAGCELFEKYLEDEHRNFPKKSGTERDPALLMQIGLESKIGAEDKSDQ